MFWIKEIDHPPKDDEREWIFGFPDEHGDVVYDEKNTYRCYCVKPVLPSGYTLTTGGSCADPKMKDNKVSCVASSPCTSTKSTCVLFRLKKTTIGTLGGVTDRDAKWEMAAAEGKEADYDKDYYYECLCVT